MADLIAVPGATAIDLDWSDVAGATAYRVWRSTNLPVATTGAPFATTTLSAFSDTSAVKGTAYYYAAATGTAAGTEIVGAMIDDATPALPTLPIKVNFSDAAGVIPAGFARDYGQNYANVRGFGVSNRRSHVSGM